MDPLNSPALIPVGESPNSSERSTRSPRRAGSFSFRNIGRKSPSPRPADASSFPFDSQESEKDKLSVKSPSPLKTPNKSPKLSFKMKNPSKEKDKEIIGEMQTESGRIRIDQTALKKTFESYDPDHYQLLEGEERRYMDPESQKLTLVQEVLETLKSWINDELGKKATRMQVTNLEDDLADGLIIRHLIESLSGEKLKMPFGEYVQSEERQQRNLKSILSQTEKIIEKAGQKTGWSVESIFSKNLLSILHLLLAIVHFYQIKDKLYLDLPKVLKVDVIVIKRSNGQTIYEREKENLFGNFPSERDDFDIIMDHDKEKHNQIKQKLLSFVNVNLGKVGKVVNDLENDFRDGVCLLLLIGLLEGFFIPLYHYHTKPKNDEEKLANIKLAFEYLEETGFDWKSKRDARPTDVLRGDQKTLWRILLTLYGHYTNSN